MERNQLALVGGVVLVIAVGGGAAAVLGLVPGTGGTDPAGSPPTVSEPATGNGTDSANATYAFEVTNLSECGRTCRIMESELTNAMNRTASNVTLTFDVYAGGDSTIWEGRKSLGALAANATAEQTTRIKVGMGGGVKIKQNDGNATIVTTVYSGGERQARFSDTQNVD